MKRLGCLMTVLVLYACDGPSVTPDAGADAGPLADSIAIEGLEGPVEVIVDDRGVPHIYATTVHDLMMVEGYLMARDRFVQMELIRRGVTGRLAEVLGTQSPDLVEDDRDSRFMGFARTGREIYESLDPMDPTRLIAQAFVAGINAYIDSVVLDPEYQPPAGNELLNLVRGSSAFGHWEPADVFALARYQAWNLSYDANADISRMRALAGVAAAFPPPATTPPPGEETPLEARAGIFGDMFSLRPARRVYTRDGFNDGTTEISLPTTLPGLQRPLPRRAPAFPALEALDGAERFFARIDESPLLRRDPHIGSNSWVVHGSKTESGHPILSNDPHLSLISPGVWWYVHLNTERMGGEDAIDAEGVAFAGLPGVVLGFNRDLAWSATTTGYDVTDVYAETVTFRNTGTPDEPVWGEPVSVRFAGADVPVTTITETIGTGGGATEPLVIHVVPHHGPIIPDSFVYPETGATTGTALSVRYTGHVPTNELAFFTGLMTARSVDDALEAQNQFRVGAQNFSFASSDGEIAWSTEARIPQREACDFAIDARGVASGYSPLLVLPGEGGYEWTTDLEPIYIPHDRNPARGYIATANQDNVGVIDDGNPCNDAHYIGGDFAVGYRMFRIDERLAALAEGAGITTDDMIALQAETKSSLGEGIRDALVASIDRAMAEPAPVDPSLEAALAEFGASGRADLIAARERLMAWTLQTPHGVGADDQADIADSVATTLFNATVTRLAALAFNDEITLIGRGPGDGAIARMLEWALDETTAQESLYTFREDYAGVIGYSDTVLWDDVSTPTTVETRDERVVRAVVAAIGWLETTLGADWDEWRWGRLHAVRFAQLVEPIADEGIVSIPPVGSAEFPLGFPRHGDYGAVDVGNFSMTNGERFTHGSGASQRLVVEMTPDGPRAFNALPGGQSEDPMSPHHADEADHWRANRQPPLYFERADVEAHAEARMQFTSP